jgi:hypothetical protein
MLIDEFLPTYNFVARQYSIEINAPIEEVYPVVRKLDLREAYFTRLILFVRSIPAILQGRPAIGTTMDDLGKMGFFLLGEDPPNELLIGFIGKLWTTTGELQIVDPARYRAFTTPGYLKGVWNFTLTPLSEGRTRLSTVSRAQSLCEESLRNTRRYWFFIRPVSGAVRLGMLRACKRQAERRSSLHTSRTERA